MLVIVLIGTLGQQPVNFGAWRPKLLLGPIGCKDQYLMIYKMEWLPGRAPAPSEEEKDASFIGTNFHRGQSVRVSGHAQRGTSYEWPNIWNGPRIYSDAIMVADYAVTAPNGSKYISVKTTWGVPMRFYCDHIRDAEQHGLFREYPSG